MSSQDQISLPYLAAILLVSGFVIRYLFFAPAAAPVAARSPEAIRRSREAAVERIQQMFPQADRRSLLWDLQRNGGNIQNTTERILSGRLDTPPPPPAQATATTSSASSARPAAAKASQPDLITRYNLKGKLDSVTEEEPKSTGSVANSTSSNTNSSKGWSSNRDERQAALQRRRDEMILAARRKMEAKIAAEKAGGQSS